MKTKYIIPLLIPTLSFAIDGGKEVKKGQFPGIVKISNYIDGNRAICTGTLVSPRLLVTAAHCVDKKNLDEIRVSKAGKVSGDVDGLFSKTFKAKNVFYLERAKFVRSEHRMISSFVNSSHFRYSSYEIQEKALANLSRLESEERNLDIAFIELTKSQEIAPKDISTISCENLPAGTFVTMVGFGKNQVNDESEENPDRYLLRGENYYLHGDYVFDSSTGNTLNSGDSGGPLLAKDAPRVIHGVASYKVSDMKGSTLSSTYSSLSSLYAKGLYRQILKDQSAPEDLKNIVKPCAGETDIINQ